jgi:energy-coupling factor transporter ATP-binding protein EcfA2
MRRLRDEFGTAIILVAHDLGVIAEMADQVIVMYAGRPPRSRRRGGRGTARVRRPGSDRQRRSQRGRH